MANFTWFHVDQFRRDHRYTTFPLYLRDNLAPDLPPSSMTCDSQANSRGTHLLPPVYTQAVTSRSPVIELGRRHRSSVAEDRKLTPKYHRPSHDQPKTQSNTSAASAQTTSHSQLVLLIAKSTSRATSALSMEGNLHQKTPHSFTSESDRRNPRKLACFYSFVYQL